MLARRLREAREAVFRKVVVRLRGIRGKHATASSDKMMGDVQQRGYAVNEQMEGIPEGRLYRV